MGSAASPPSWPAGWCQPRCLPCSSSRRSITRSSVGPRAARARRRLRPEGRECYASALLLGDDLVLDAVIGLLRHDVLLHQFVLALVGTALDDGRGIRLANAGQRVELFGAGGIDVEQVGLGRRRHL